MTNKEKPVPGSMIYWNRETGEAVEVVPKSKKEPWCKENIAYILQPLKEARRSDGNPPVLDAVSYTFFDDTAVDDPEKEIVKRKTGTPEEAMREGMKEACASMHVLGALYGEPRRTTPTKTKIKKLEALMLKIRATTSEIDTLKEETIISLLDGGVSIQGLAGNRDETKTELSGIRNLKRKLTIALRVLKLGDDPFSTMDTQKASALNNVISILLDSYTAITGRKPQITVRHIKGKTFRTGPAIEYLDRALGHIPYAEQNTPQSYASKIRRYNKHTL